MSGSGSAVLRGELGSLTFITTDEWTNAAAPAVAGLRAATAPTFAPETVLAAALLSPGKAALLAYPRNVTFTTAGSTPADAPATATITGTDINGDALVEIVNLAQTATIAEGVKAFKTITSIVFTSADTDPADCTVAIGFGKKFGLSKPAKTRAGAMNILGEVANAAVVTTGTYVIAATSAPNGTYSPSADPDAAKDYALTYEYVPAA